MLGAVTRWTSIIPRRTYRVAGSNALWHIDGNHKLIRWKFVTHAGIDGYSRIITFIHCSGNNKSTTVFTHFKGGCDTFGTPSRVRADHGGENIMIQRFMNSYRGEGRGSFGVCTFESTGEACAAVGFRGQNESGDCQAVVFG